ncbi:MAG: DHH family phosphoesterase [Flavobacteriales bacterium]
MLTKEILEKIEEANYIVFTAHKGPDGDACGSTLAMYYFFKQLNKKVDVVLPNPTPNYLRHIPGSDLVVDFETQQKKATECLEQADFIFCLDYNHPSRVGQMEEALLKATGTKMMIDHHLNPADFCDFVVSKPEISSTCQMVFDFLQAYDESKIYTPEIMKCIYTGILTDTGSFRFSSVDARTHEIAMKFKEHHFDHEIIHRQLFDDNKPNRMKLLGYCINQKMQLFLEKKIGFLSLTSEELKSFDCTKQDTEGFVNYLLSMQGIEVAVFFIEQANEIKMSLRAVGNWHVNEIVSEYYNGGGHQSAAGGHFVGEMQDLQKHFEANVFPKLETYHR